MFIESSFLSLTLHRAAVSMFLHQYEGPQVHSSNPNSLGFESAQAPIFWNTHLIFIHVFSSWLTWLNEIYKNTQWKKNTNKLKIFTESKEYGYEL